MALFPFGLTFTRGATWSVVGSYVREDISKLASSILEDHKNKREKTQRRRGRRRRKKWVKSARPIKTTSKECMHHTGSPQEDSIYQLYIYILFPPCSPIILYNIYFLSQFLPIELIQRGVCQLGTQGGLLILIESKENERTTTSNSFPLLWKRTVIIYHYFFFSLFSYISLYLNWPIPHDSA